MPSFEAIYAGHAAMYERLIAREDYQGNIMAALRTICPLDGLDVVEAGAGTGRLTRLIAPFARSIRAFDRSPHMLEVAHQQLLALPHTNWQLGVADNQSLPVASASADLAIEGWSFGHATVWHPEQWRAISAAAVGELRRVVRPGGTIVLFETLGSGQATPAAPSEGLAAFYDWLEHEQGFSTTWVRTDYCFASAAEAEQLTAFFFGASLPAELQPGGQAIVAECTGVWWATAG